jgi:hypothetical protein
MRSSRSAVLCLIMCCATLSAAVTLPKFFARRDYPSACYFVYVGDVTGDGIPEIVTLPNQDQLSTLQGYGDGTFHKGVTNIRNWLFINGGALVDLNGDGKQDLIISGSPDGGGIIGVMFSNGDGTFQPPVLYTVSDGNLGSETVGDFNGDGIPDVRHRPQRYVAVYRKGRRRFQHRGTGSDH